MIPYGKVISTYIGENEIKSKHISTGEVKVTEFADYLTDLTVPDTATWFSTHYILPETPKIVLIENTNKGAIGYVMVSDKATTGIQLVASTSGVICNVGILL